MKFRDVVCSLIQGQEDLSLSFSAVLFICAVWDFGILLCMLRNSHESELIIYGYIVFLPCTFLAALIYHFTTTYLQQPKKKTTIILWVFSILGFIVLATGLGGKIDDVFHYSWGNIYRLDRTLQISTLFSIPVGFFAAISSSWMLFQESKRESSPIKRRHMIYMAISFAALTLAYVKLAVLYNVDNAFILPAGMFVNDIFSAVIAIAIVKHHLFDITVIIKKGAIYSALAGIVIFVFSFSEHVLITYMGELIGGHSQLIHFISIGVGILVLMPIKHRVEGRVEKIFAEKRVEF
ncbi:MAG: hypothetical protein E3J30_06145 [Anaerolineales bacterium]|nr:MAG: hypothetical protein E3J30_06145 [Anaerolineales bacterium]